MSIDFFDYVDRIKTQAADWTGHHRELIDQVMMYVKNRRNYQRQNSSSQVLQTMLEKSLQTQLADVFAGEEFKVLELLLGQWAQPFKNIWDRLPLYIFQQDEWRRSYRAAKTPSAYLPLGVTLLGECIYLSMQEISFANYFSRPADTWDRKQIVAHFIANALDQGDTEIFAALHDVIYGENTGALLNRVMLKGLLMSRRPDVHKLVGDLLMAARLQEGLRQTICECMDEGSKEGFLYLLRLMLDNDLQRFSSIIRAVDVWTGLGISGQKPAVVKKCLEAAWEGLTDLAARERLLASRDSLLLYMGLWCVAFDDMTDTKTPIAVMLAQGEQHQKLAALGFLSQLQMPYWQHACGLPALSDPDWEVRAWAVANLLNSSISLKNRKTGLGLSHYGTKQECDWLFQRLQALLDELPKRELVFEPSIFPWWRCTLASDTLLEKMFILYSQSSAADIFALFCAYLDRMNPDHRLTFFSCFLTNPQSPAQKQVFLSFLADRSESVRAKAWKAVKRLSLEEQDFLAMEDMLRSRSGQLRKSVVQLLARQDAKALETCIVRLLAAKNENVRLGGLDLLETTQADPSLAAVYAACAPLAAQTVSTQKERLRMEAVADHNADLIDPVKGMGLFSPAETFVPPVMEANPEVAAILTLNKEETEWILGSLNTVIEQHRDYEYDTQSWAVVRKVTLGGESRLLPLAGADRNSCRLEDYPLAEVWLAWRYKEGLTTQMLLRMAMQLTSGYSDQEKQPWFLLLMETFLGVKNLRTHLQSIEIPWRHHMKTILPLLLTKENKEEVFQIAHRVCQYLFVETESAIFAINGRNDETHRCNNFCSINIDLFSYWLNAMRQYVYDDESFRQYFTTAYAFYSATGFRGDASLELSHFERALTLGFINKAEVYCELCARPLSGRYLGQLTKKWQEGQRFDGQTPDGLLADICKNVLRRVAEIEMMRGELPTPVSALVAAAGLFCGAKIFVGIVLGIGRDSYVHGYNFVSNNSTRKQIFSHMLKCLWPEPEDTADSLRVLLAGKTVTKQQLIDAAMYAPQWLDIIEQYLGWPGLRSAGWCLHAHVSEHFTAWKEGMIARFSPVDSGDFQEGAFDANWFHEAYHQLGAERFDYVYKSAKYISTGPQYKRAQKFVDAALNRLDREEMRHSATVKRNRDALLAYCLIPLTDEADLLERYLFLETFRKQSKQFGAQRQAAENRAANIALSSLARSAGYADETRMVWRMETKEMQNLAQWFTPVLIGDCSFHIAVDEVGRTELKIEKSGKSLTNIPAALKKDPTIVELREIVRALRDKHSRTRAALERCMIHSNTFTAAELNDLAENPIVAPMLRHLVFIIGDVLGYFAKGMLHAPDGTCTAAGDGLRIAHAVDLYRSGQWAVFQKDLYDRQIVQAFRQVFRELYQPTADELAALNMSMRYAGHQVQPRQGVALLKSRGWTVGFEGDIQKIDYESDTAVELYSQADWFTPAEMECPSIEWIRFFDRKTNQSKNIADVPAIVFSEIMRDIDLVVSVAHAGGVDPEASHSTIEMRTVLLTEMLRLLRLTESVNIKGTHAFIKGSLGEYTVHLGSGVAHKMAHGALYIIPVHAQQRGRIFLPFLDEDPKTAEILSKVVLLAEDRKLKDPTILAQLSGN